MLESLRFLHKDITEVLMNQGRGPLVKGQIYEPLTDGGNMPIKKQKKRVKHRRRAMKRTGATSTTTDRQIEANRENARKSTGPKTERGKKTVRFNALKHGLLAEQTVIMTENSAETKEDFNELLNNLTLEHQPKTPTEMLLVERIANCFWRQRRLARYETAHITHAIEEVTCEQNRAVRDNNMERDIVLGINEPYERATRDLHGLTFLIRLVVQCKFFVEEHGMLDEYLMSRLFRAYSRRKTSFAAVCFTICNLIIDPKMDPQTLPVEIEAPANAETLLRTIQMELDHLDKLHQELERHHERQLEIETARCLLPPDDVANKILRYETLIERQLNRALRELRRLQSTRDYDPDDNSDGWRTACCADHEKGTCDNAVSYTHLRAHET